MAANNLTEKFVKDNLTEEFVKEEAQIDNTKILAQNILDIIRQWTRDNIVLHPFRVGTTISASAWREAQCIEAFIVEEIQKYNQKINGQKIHDFIIKRLDLLLSYTPKLGESLDRTLAAWREKKTQIMKNPIIPTNPPPPPANSPESTTTTTTASSTTTSTIKTTLKRQYKPLIEIIDDDEDDDEIETESESSENDVIEVPDGKKREMKTVTPPPNKKIKHNIPNTPRVLRSKILFTKP